jgi:hypothetical protein
MWLYFANMHTRINIYGLKIVRQQEIVKTFVPLFANLLKHVSTFVK